MPDWKMGDPLPQRKPGEEAQPVRLPWVLFSQEGKRLNRNNLRRGVELNLPNYMCRQGEYPTHDAALAAKKLYEHYYPQVPFVVLHRDDPQIVPAPPDSTVTFDPIYPRVDPPRQEVTPRAQSRWTLDQARLTEGPIESPGRSALRRWQKRVGIDAGEKFTREDLED